MNKCLTFGLDFDKTITSESAGFQVFAKTMRGLGHKVYIVTMRYPSEVCDLMKIWEPLVDGIVFTERLAKRKVTEHKGIHVDIWIDDNPCAVEKSAVELWGWASAEGQVME